MENEQGVGYTLIVCDCMICKSRRENVVDSWVVFQIGCLECGVDSELVGWYDTEEKADIMLELMNKRFGGGGQVEFEKFKMEQCNKTNEEFL